MTLSNQKWSEIRFVEKKYYDSKDESLAQSRTIKRNLHICCWKETKIGRKNAKFIECSISITGTCLPMKTFLLWRTNLALKMISCIHSHLRMHLIRFSGTKSLITQLQLWLRGECFIYDDKTNLSCYEQGLKPRTKISSCCSKTSSKHRSKILHQFIMKDEPNQALKQFTSIIPLWRCRL